MNQPSEQDGDELRADELRFRARRSIGSGGGRSAPRLLLVVLFFAGMVFVASVAVYFVNQREMSYAPQAQTPAAKPTSPVSSSIRSPVDPAQAPLSSSSESEEGSRLYKCKGPKGESTYANSPCPPTHETVWVRSIQPDRRTPPPPPASGSDPVLQPAPREIVYAVPQPPSESEQRRMRCANARQYEADVRRRRGLKITFDELRRLSDMVYEACKPQP